MFKLIMAMIVPILIFIYTCSFGKWLHKQTMKGAVSAYVLGFISIGTTGIVFWRMFT